MEKHSDITGFWLAWRKTCSIRRCLDAKILARECAEIPEVRSDIDKVVADANYVIKTSNKYFADMIRSPRSVKPLKKFAYATCAAEDEECEADERTPDVCTRDDSRVVFRDIEGAPSLGETGLTQEAKDDMEEVRPSTYTNSLEQRHGRGKMISEYRDLVESWYHHDANVTNAFELVEIDLYREAGTKLNEDEKATYNKGGVQAEPMLNGKKLKDYLFEDICAATGNISKSLWGYLLKKDPTPQGISRLRMVANDSFRNPVEDRSGDTGGASALDTPDPAAPDVREEAHMKLADDALYAYWRQEWQAKYDVLDRLALCCGLFGYSMSDPFIATLIPDGKNLSRLPKILSDRKMKLLGKTWKMLKERGFDMETTRNLFNVQAVEVLRRVAVNEEPRDPVCVRLYEHFDNLKKANGI